jgi:L,D-peptidoglycan transpeptidase YkuD (ErfK/YbiS/YcfS/YnhG family)
VVGAPVVTGTVGVLVGATVVAAATVETGADVVAGCRGAGSEQAATAIATTTASHRPQALRPRATTTHGSGVTGRFVLGTVVVGLLLVTCGPGAASPTASPTAGPRVTVAAATTTASTVTTPTTVAAASSAPTTEAAGPPSTASVVAPAVPAELDRAGDSGQAVLVTADGYGSTTATLTAWQRTPAGGWEQAHGPWPAWIGSSGFAPPDQKREGDGRTPSGTFGFEFLFGVKPDPGVTMPYRRVTGPSIVWDDVPSSPTYNQWVDGGGGEPMYVSPVYDYGAVIAYNTARTPGLGSAIFLHVAKGAPTAGCVSLPVDRLLAVLRWLDPARSPVIVMGVA